ncbi:hypothetical protein PMZ80_011320, partial [Knufia obscura]
IKKVPNAQLADDETTGKDDFKFKESPEVCAVIVDKDSERGFAQISGGSNPTEIIQTGLGDTGQVMVKILADQSCMLYGRPTVLFVYPHS